MTQYVYDFSEGDKDQKDLLGGKGANLAEMTNLGLPNTVYAPKTLFEPVRIPRQIIIHQQRAKL